MTEDTQIRDRLARERTHLANERTYLSYIRTALALFLGAGFILKFETSSFWIGLAFFLILLGGVTLAIGTVRYISYRENIKKDQKVS
jgi:putative membrane protein